MLPPSHLYARLLLPTCNGYPLFRPQPFDDLPAESKKRGTEIGDVGIVTSDGAFDVIFNICRAADDPCNRFGVPDDFEQVHLGPGDVELSSHYHELGSDVSNTMISKRRLDLDAGTESNVFLPLGAGAVVEISTSSKETAVLLLPDGAARADLRPKKRFRDYALKHAQRWYAFVNGDRLERMIGNGELYLVTGVDKTASWSVAAVENHAENCKISLKLKATQVGVAGAACAWEWERASASMHSGPRGLLDSDDPRTQNQTVFLRGFKVAIGKPPLNRSAKAVHIMDSTPTAILSKHKFIPFSQPSSATRSSFFWTSNSGNNSPSDSSDEDEPLESAEYFPGASKPYHPADAINNYLLDSSCATTAVTHDDEWGALLHQDDEDVPPESELVQRLLDEYDIEITSGAACLRRRNTEDPSLHKGGPGLHRPKYHQGNDSATPVRARVYNFHGEPGARLHADESVYGTVRKRTLLITLFNPLLFYAPEFHLVGLHTMYTDGLVRDRGWSEFITRLNKEWQEFTLYSTVVLNASVAFLSIPSVDQNGVASLERTPAQMSGYLSILTSIGAIIIGLLLMKQNRDRDRLTASDAAEFIFNRTHPTLGLETLAVLYSLPYAMLIWSMVSFLAAFSFMCFESSSVVIRTLIAVLGAAVAALILWCIFAAGNDSATPVYACVYNFHGEPGVRLHADKSVYGTIRKQTLLITLLNPLLFYAPDFHLVGLHTIYTDGLVRDRGWPEFITRLNKEWQEFTLYSTVVLNASVAFLSIPSVDQNGVASLEHTPAQISSYLSILTSIGAIIIELLLVRQNRDRLTASDFNRTHPTLGLETLAVLYSLPYAMLIWSMVSFLAAFSFMCFESSSVVTPALSDVLWPAVLALILWCILTAWDGDWDWLQGYPFSGTATEDVVGVPTGSKSKQRKWRDGVEPHQRAQLTYFLFSSLSLSYLYCRLPYSLLSLSLR
ncbi:hypothetical protein DFH09DRAFT_1135118 [Mycena vulgaris]|nr:hypothetical protein DFH09DRAFT_1135118 [Mycena vulgaris]